MKSKLQDPNSPISAKHQRPYLAVYCLVLVGSKLLMLQRTGTTYADGFWSLPAGHVDVGESISTAASRELAEETNLAVPPDEWRILTMMHRKTEERTIVDVFLKAHSFDGVLRNREPEKHSHLSFYDIGGLPRPIIPYVKVVTEFLAKPTDVHVPTLIEFGW